jgi:hypothetical protein
VQYIETVALHLLYFELSTFVSFHISFFSWPFLLNYIVHKATHPTRGVLVYQFGGFSDGNIRQSKGCKLCGIFWSLQSKSHCISVLFSCIYLFLCTIILLAGHQSLIRTEFCMTRVASKIIYVHLYNSHTLS